jgi:hypothetical protein
MYGHLITFLSSSAFIKSIGGFEVFRNKKLADGQLDNYSHHIFRRQQPLTTRSLLERSGLREKAKIDEIKYTAERKRLGL